MSEATLTLRELFEVDTKDLSARVESGFEADKTAKAVQQEIVKEARSIRWPWVRHSVAAESKDLLNVNVVDLLVNCWKKYMQISEYADTEKYGPGEEILAPLATHTMRSEHRPYVQILLKEKEIGRVIFHLEFSLILEGFVLKIRDARIMEILTGSGQGEGSLSLVEVPLWKRELKPVRFPGQLSLGSGIPLGS